jgi:anaerobic ribonucleoside-triphosphate reductase
MPIRKIQSVRKRDGRLVPYDEQKIVETIQLAAREAKQDNPTVGRDLAGVVTMYLERYSEREVPACEEIQQLVEKILLDTGHAAVARAYIVYRERKGLPAEAAAPPTEDLFPSNLLLVDGSTRDEVALWGRDRIIGALVKEAGLEPAAAGEIAGTVEQKIFRLGQRRVSTSLIRELVNHELLARGFGSKLRRQIVVGLPKYDLGRIVGEEEPRVDPEGMCRVIGQTTLRQYALQEIFTRDVADAHLEGFLHLHGLEEPLKFHSLAPSVPAIRRTGVRVRGSAALSEPARDARTFTAQLGRIVADARRYVAGPLSFGRLSEAYDQLLWGLPDEAMRSETEHLAAALDDARTGVDARHRTAAGIAALGRSTVAVAEVEEGIKDFCRAAVDRGMTFAFDRGAPPLPGEVASSAWKATGQAVTINLPQSFFRSEAAGSDFYTELENALNLAVRAHVQKRQLLRRFADRATGTFGLGLGWVSDGAGAVAFDGMEYAVGLGGLNEAVKLLSGEEILSTDAAVRLAQRIVSYVYFRLKEEEARQGMRLVLGDVPPGDAIERFVRIDMQMYPRARGLMVDRERYTPGFRVGGAPSFEALAVESRFHTLVPSARAVADRSKLAPADLFTLLARLKAETLATHLCVE